MPPRAAPGSVGPFAPEGGDLCVRLTNTQEGHNKFYMVEVNGSTLRTEWGSIQCAKPQSSVKTFASAGAACVAANKVYAEKTSVSKGYKRSRSLEEAGGDEPEPKHQQTQQSLEVMLAHNYTGDFSFVAGWWVGEKYDGVRALWTGEALYTRNGNRIHAPEWFTRALPCDLALDGELWIGYGNAAFNAVSGLVRMLKADDARWLEVSYLVFDAPKTPGSLSERLKCLPNFREAKHVRLVEHAPVTTAEALKASLAAARAAGAEGLMLRDPDSPYVNGRSKRMLKLKPFQDAEAVVTGYNWVTGGPQSLACSMDGKSFSVKVTEAVMKHPPALGAQVTVTFFELTENGVPRFPCFKGIRTDL